MIEHLIQFSIGTLAVYAILIGIYYGVGVVVIAVNRRFPRKRIQDRDCPKERVRADVIQSTKSLVVIAAFTYGGIFLQEKILLNYNPDLTLLEGVAIFLASLLAFDTWFYWGHRLIHSKFLYARVHKWHHVSVTPTIWSNNSDTFLDNCFLQSYFLVVGFFLPIHPHLLLAHKIFDQVSGMFGHAGFEYFAGKTSRYPWPFITTLYHDQHHLYFTCNYATTFSIWDRLMGTIHATYDDRVRTYSRTL